VKTVYIYVLIDPETRECRYVGKTISLRGRFRKHYLAGNAEKLTWLEKLKERGLQPVMEVLEETNPTDWASRERWWIAEGKRLGWPLLNADTGGWGGPDPKPATRERMRQSHIGKRLSESAKEKLRVHWTGRKRSEIEREKVRQRNHHWGWKISQSKMGHGVSAESRQKMSESRKRYFERVGIKSDIAIDYFFHHPEDATLSSHVIAAALGINHHAVLEARRQLGIQNGK